MPSPDKNAPQNSTLRVVIASAQRGWYGGESQASLLAIGLRKRGHEVHLLARQGEAFAQRMAKEGFPVTELASGGRSLRGILQARRAIRQLRPDVLHANDSHALTCLLLAGFGLRIPARIASRRVTYPIRSPFQFRFFADRVACVATAVFEKCREASLPEKKLAIVFSSVDPARIVIEEHEEVRARTRDSLGLASNSLLLLCVGKLTFMKGHADLLQAMPGVLEKYPDLVLALVGDGELLDTLQSQAKQLGVERSVRFLGYRHDVHELVHAADLYVQPSRSDGEGLCNAVIEAMLAERPIVVSTGGGFRDLIPSKIEGSSTPSNRHETLSSDYGWLTPPDDPTRLAATLLDALDASQDERHGRGKLARTRALENFTADQMVDRMLQVYRDAISDNS